MRRCEECGKKCSHGWGIDWCATCDRDLCNECMSDGCCGVRPAVSGMDRDFGPKLVPKDAEEIDGGFQLEGLMSAEAKRK